jgi:hypothetical protein
MLLYFWIKKGAEKLFQDMQDQGLLGKGLKAELDPSSNRYRISFWGDPMNPAIVLPTIPDEIVEKVTMLDEAIYQGFVPDGKYYYKNAVLMARLEIFGSIQIPKKRQFISIGAPNIEEFRTIYTLVRQRQLDPHENWMGDPSNANID